ncbi:hypothetical protein [Flectobacillus longus]|uniref:hypothetical protein n=1 Tax=Flectobacillus longus TaxID=2984207 RepID=UPI0024B7B4F4|nr:hypothetical protein [Flectobacillus longus]MDI9882793.1 hypothetical protein [Flectobacillus longus]
MKIRAILLVIDLFLTNKIITQSSVLLAGACNDCVAIITAFTNCSVASAGTLLLNKKLTKKLNNN